MFKHIIIIVPVLVLLVRYFLGMISHVNNREMLGNDARTTIQNLIHGTNVNDALIINLEGRF
jgi:hypothetical protein